MLRVQRPRPQASCQPALGTCAGAACQPCTRGLLQRALAPRCAGKTLGWYPQCRGPSPRRAPLREALAVHQIPCALRPWTPGNQWMPEVVQRRSILVFQSPHGRRVAELQHAQAEVKAWSSHACRRSSAAIFAKISMLQERPLSEGCTSFFTSANRPGERLAASTIVSHCSTRASWFQGRGVPIYRAVQISKACAVHAYLQAPKSCQPIQQLKLECVPGIYVYSCTA